MEDFNQEELNEKALKLNKQLDEYKIGIINEYFDTDFCYEDIAALQEFVMIKHNEGYGFNETQVPMDSEPGVIKLKFDLEITEPIVEDDE